MNITTEDIKSNSAEWLLNKLQEMSADGALQTISDLYDELNKPKYPKIFGDCCRVVNNGHLLHLPTPTEIGYKGILLHRFQHLLVCRDAYWKIAGEEMGLGRPWKPESIEMSHAIVCRDDGDFLLHRRTRAILIFPTEEMRDAFYENFKELIEECKELL